MPPQGKYWLLTIPHAQFIPYLPPACSWIKGQLELGEGGFLHWQVIVAFRRKVRPGKVREVFGNVHHELTRSAAAEEYVHKEETRVVGTQFELGRKDMKRNSDVDWDQIWESAKTGDMMAIPADVRIRSYHTLKRIRKDYENPLFRNGVVVKVFYGATGTGKSHRMFQECGDNFYVKSSTTKWWDGYRGEENVVIDEFRGKIDISHLLKWFDKYPCVVEEKGGQLALKATKFWVCSNLSPHDWYPECDQETRDALLRRLQVTHFQDPFNVLHMLHQVMNE